MTSRIAITRTAALVAVLLSLAACGTSETHHASNDIPDKWWSDNYFAMVADSDASQPKLAGAKPIRMKLQ